jgi:mitochondrial fission protein ELM1
MTEPDLTAKPAWVIAEAFAGLQAQGLGLAEACGLIPDICSFTPRWPWSLVPASFWPEPLGAVGLDKNPPEGLLFTVGGKAAVIGACLRRKGRVVVQVQHPRIDSDKFDLVVVNRHDRLRGPNVIITRTALHRATPERLKAAKEIWAPRFAHLPRPLVAVLVGGSNGRFRLEEAEGVALARQLSQMILREKVGLMLTPSRRTAPLVRDTLTRSLAPLGGYVWNMAGENPYFGMLACADLIIATIDSVSMISEACATSVPVLVQELPGRSRKIAQFVDGLAEDGRVRRFAGSIDFWPVTPMDDTAEAAAEVRRRLGF